MPDKLEKGIGTTPIPGGLDTAAGRQAPVAILGGAESPAVRRPVVLQLERLVLADLVLVGRDIDALLHAHVAQVEAGDEGGLRQGVLQGEQLVPRHRRGARLKDRLGPDGRQVLSLAIPERQMSAMVLGTEQAVLVAHHLQLSIGVQISRVGFKLNYQFFVYFRPWGSLTCCCTCAGHSGRPPRHGTPE